MTARIAGSLLLAVLAASAGRGSAPAPNAPKTALEQITAALNAGDGRRIEKIVNESAAADLTFMDRDRRETYRGKKGRRAFVASLRRIAAGAHQKAQGSRPQGGIDCRVTERDGEAGGVEQEVDFVYHRRQTDGQGRPLPETGSDPEKPGAAVVQTATFFHSYRLTWSAAKAQERSSPTGPAVPGGPLQIRTVEFLGERGVL